MIRVLHLGSGQVPELHRKESPFARMTLVASPGEEWILNGELPFGTSELMLAENLR